MFNSIAAIQARRLGSHRISGVTAWLFLSLSLVFSSGTHAASAAVEAALLSGDATTVADANELLEAAIESIDNAGNTLKDERISIFNLENDGRARADGSSLTEIDWDPSWDAALLNPVYGKNIPLLVTNNVEISGRTIRQKPIAVIGQSDTSRYLVMGSNPMRNDYRGGEVSADMHQLLQNSLSWLTGRTDLATEPFNVVIAQMGQSYYFPDQVATRSWLQQRYADSVSFNERNACNDAALAGCLDADTDLLIVSQIAGSEDQVASIRNAVSEAMQNGIAVLYLHHDGNLTVLGNALFSLLDVQYESDNRWQSLRLTDWNPVSAIGQIPAELVAVKTLLNHFLAADYAFDWSVCDGENCSAVAGLDSEFLQGADHVRRMLAELDRSKRDVFDESGFRLHKLLALVADRFRQDVVYPMDKVVTDDNVFMRSYFADHAQYQYRSINPLQPDMGNFSRSDFGHITPTSRRVTLTSKRNFRSTGAYALPGQTFTVTRNDSSNVVVQVYLNSLRPGATHQWAVNGYTRPKFLQGQSIAIAPGEIIRMTSAYGGPIHLSFNKNDLPVDVTISNIGEHAHWASSADDASFTAKLDAGNYDWAELVTPGFEVHSKLDKMRNSMTDPKWGSAQALAEATMRYMHNFPHALAGFSGPGIEPIVEVDRIAEQHGWTIDNLDIVKHMNADQALCGYGCSGNPYDAYWSYSPVGHGDVHELGHGLQGRQRFNGWENHSMTNFYSYYTKSRFHQTTGQNPQCQGLPFARQFGVLQQAANAANQQTYMQEHWWDDAGWSEQASMLIQMMMAAQYHGVLEDGWHLRALLHIAEREFYRGDNNEDSWAAAKDRLGFGSFTLQAARLLNNNDRILIMSSYATGLDFRDYLDMWGIPYSDAAAAQVAAFDFPQVAHRYFISSSDGYCWSGQNGNFLGKASLPVDGGHSWPAAEDNDGDGYWNAVDNCAAISNSDQADLDGDGNGDACDSRDDRDPDEDGVPNYLDRFPDDPDESADADGDEIGDNADPDDDNDGVEDMLDAFPLDSSESADSDGDLIGDNADEDDDNDRVVDGIDNCPYQVNPLQLDEDGDRIGNRCDIDYEELLCFPIKGQQNMVMICL